MKVRIINRSHHQLPEYATAQSAGVLETFSECEVVYFAVRVFAGNTEFVQPFVDEVDIDCDYWSAEVENYVFDVGHCCCL